MEPQFKGDTNDGEQGDFPKNSPEQRAQRKRLFSVVFSVGLAAIVIGTLSLADRITSPFPKAKNSNTNTTVANSLQELKNRDTDGDGLSDYDELFPTGHRATSPFLKDSDGDGISDGDEIKKGTDPNCPDEITHTPCGPVPTTNGNTNVSSNPQAAAIREALKKSGAPANIVDNTDDATLLKQYQSAIIGSTNVNSATNSPLDNVDLNNLSTSQLRTLLESNGVDAATLGSLDDATLQSIYQQALTNNTNTSTSP